MVWEENKVYCIDCLDGMKQIENETIDLIITDPPYGDNEVYGRDEKFIQNNEDPTLNLLIIRDAYRILKKDKAMYLFTNWKHYPFLMQFVKEYTKFEIKGLLVWDKTRFGMGYPFRNQYELILVLSKGQPEFFDLGFPNCISIPPILHDENTHPHEKPKELIRRLIRNSSKVGDLVLDTCVGGGQIVMACKEMNRKFIGFEIDKRWVDYTSEKLKQTTMEEWFK